MTGSDENCNDVCRFAWYCNAKCNAGADVTTCPNYWKYDDLYSDSLCDEYMEDDLYDDFDYEEDNW